MWGYPTPCNIKCEGVDIMRILSVKERYREKTRMLGDKLYGTSYEVIERCVIDHVEQCIFNNDISVEILDAVVYGSRSRGRGTVKSDIDVVVEYRAVTEKIKEYVLFNLVNEIQLYIAGYLIDINLITADESGTLEIYLLKAESYQESIDK